MVEVDDGVGGSDDADGVNGGDCGGGCEMIKSGACVECG